MERGSIWQHHLDQIPTWTKRISTYRSLQSHEI